MDDMIKDALTIELSWNDHSPLKNNYFSSPKLSLISNAKLQWSRKEFDGKLIIDDIEIASSLKPTLFSYRQSEEEKMRLDQYFNRRKLEYNKKIKIRSNFFRKNTIDRSRINSKKSDRNQELHLLYNTMHMRNRTSKSKRKENMMLNQYYDKISNNFDQKGTNFNKTLNNVESSINLEDISSVWTNQQGENSMFKITILISIKVKNNIKIENKNLNKRKMRLFHRNFTKYTISSDSKHKAKINLNISEMSKNYCILNTKVMQIDTPKNWITKLQNLVSSENKFKKPIISQKSTKPRFKYYFSRFIINNLRVN